MHRCAKDKESSSSVEPIHRYIFMQLCRHIINIQKNEMLSVSRIVVLALQLWTIQITECAAQSGRSV